MTCETSHAPESNMSRFDGYCDNCGAEQDNPKRLIECPSCYEHVCENCIAGVGTECFECENGDDNDY